MIYMLVSPIRLLDQERKYLLIILCPCQLIKRGMAHPRCFDCLMNELVSSYINQLSSVQFSCSVVSDFLRPHESQHARPPCPSPSPGVYSNSRPSSQWFHPAISSSVVPFSSCPQSLPAPESFPMSQLFTWGGQSTGVSALAKQIPGLISFRMDWLDLLAVQGTLKSFLQHHSSKASILWCSAFFTVQLSHPYMTNGKTIALTRRTFVGKVMSLLFNMLSRLVITFPSRGKRLLISWLQSPSAMILGPQKMKSDTVSTVCPSISHELILSHKKECIWVSSNEVDEPRAYVKVRVRVRVLVRVKLVK